MNYSSPFDHDSLMYKLMKYLYKIEQQMQKVQFIWILVDVIQFLTIITSLLGSMIKKHYKIVEQDLFDNFLNIFFNYSKIYNWLVISGACSAFIVILGLIIYVRIQFKTQIKQQTKKRVLNYCALVGTIVLGLFQTFSQVMANNLINIVGNIFSKKLEMDVFLICFFLLNMIMMIFISIFNSNRRIFRFSLIIVSLSLNMLPFTLTCALLVILSLYYQHRDKIIYKKLFYFLIILTCIWTALQSNDPYEYLLTARLIYLSLGSIALILYFFHYQKNIQQSDSFAQNNYLIDLYEKKVKKQDNKQDYLLADQYFIRYFDLQRQDKNNMYKGHNYDFYLTNSTKQWHQSDYKEKILEKIRYQKVKFVNQISNYINYFKLLFRCKINITELLSQIIVFMQQHKNENIYVIYQINRMTNLIQKQFMNNIKNDQNILKVDQIIYLEELYRSFYLSFQNTVDLLGQIFERLQQKNGQIDQISEQKLVQFTLQVETLQKTLKQIKSIVGFRLEVKLYQLLAEIWNKYQNKENSFLTSNNQNKISIQFSKQKYDFSYFVISNQKIRYASIKFLSTYSYKQTYIVGQSISMIFPDNFNFYLLQLLQRNHQKLIFQSQLLIKNQKDLFEIVNATFYLLPQFKGQITYLVKIKRIPEFQLKNLLLFNCETFCIQGFNKKIVKNFKFSTDKLQTIRQNGVNIQFSDLFIFNNEEKQFLTLAQKTTGVSYRNKKNVEIQFQDKNKEEKVNQMKALLKMEYLSGLKKSSMRNVLLGLQQSFQISNMTYKVIRVEDTNAIRQLETESHLERTQEIGLLNNRHGSNLNLQYTTKDLKKKFQSEKNFCPISNPYKPKILDRINSINSNKRVKNTLYIKITYVIAILLFFCGILSFKISQQQVKSQITKFKDEAQSLNDQYSYFMDSALNSYLIYHMIFYPEQFKKYFQQSRSLSVPQIEAFYQKEIQFLLQEKSQLIVKFQQAYFDFPIIEDAPAISITIKTAFFDLVGNSHSTLIYDIILFLVDSVNPEILQLISDNFGLYQKLLLILKPDGKYDSKIALLKETPAIILLVTSLLIIIAFIIIIVLQFQIRQARQQVIFLYQFIEKKQIQKNIQKVQQIKNLTETLSNKKNFLKMSTHNQLQQIRTVSQINSQLNLKMQDFEKNQQDSVKTFEQQNQINGQCQSQNFLKRQIKKKKKNIITQGPQRIFVIIETIIKNYFYLLILSCMIGLALYIHYSTMPFFDGYIQAFKYFQKLRSSNFRFHYQIIKAQRYAFYYSVQHVKLNITEQFSNQIIFKKTHFQYQSPQYFSLNQQDYNLCPNNIEQKIVHRFVKDLKCLTVDKGILKEQFSQVYQRYQNNLKQISQWTYLDLIENQQARNVYLNTLYLYHAIQVFFEKVMRQNFPENIEIMNQKLQKILNYQLILATAFVIFALAFSFSYLFIKMENQVQMIVLLIKMIPPDTLFSMKTASLFKKRNILQKLDKL